MLPASDLCLTWWLLLIVGSGSHAFGRTLVSVAVFMASDKASGMTGTTVNFTMGSLDSYLTPIC